MKLKRTLKELIHGKNTYISEKQKARIRMDSEKPTTGSKQTRDMMSNLSQSDYDEIQKKFGQKKLTRSK